MPAYLVEGNVEASLQEMYIFRWLEFYGLSMLWFLPKDYHVHAFHHEQLNFCFRIAWDMTRVKSSITHFQGSYV